MDKQAQDERWQSLTEDGRQARIASYQELLKLQKDEANSYLITIEDLEKLYGKHNLKTEQPIRKEGWVNVYKEGSIYSCRAVFDSKKEALECRADDYITTLKIEWEE